MTPRRIAFWLLATAGVAVGHILGYALAHPSGAAREAALGGHAYLPATASVLVPLGVLVALVWAIRTARDLGLSGRLDVRQLALAQLAIFSVQELAERALSGAGASAALTERGVWFGLVAQVVVAHLITRSVDVVRRVVRLVVGGRVPRGIRERVPLPFSSRPALLIAVAPVAVGLRAPPGFGSIR